MFECVLAPCTGFLKALYECIDKHMQAYIMYAYVLTVS